MAGTNSFPAFLLRDRSVLPDGLLYVATACI